MCSKPDVQKIGDTIIVDSTCKIGPLRHQLAAVITGDFNSAYTVKVVSKQEGPAIPGMPAERTMTIDAKWIGRLQGRPEARRHDHGRPQDQRPRSAEHAGDAGRGLQGPARAAQKK